jgi:hypothetical protein
MVQDLVARFSQDDLRDDMTILVARVSPAGASQRVAADGSS